MVKKGQIKIQQMAFMLIAVTLFFVMVGLFVLSFRFAGLKNSANLLEEKNALLLVTKLANTPEFSCGGAFGTDKINCVDLDKISALKNNAVRYLEFWGGGIYNILVITSDETIDIFSKGVGGYSAENFVTVCKNDQDGEKCDIGRLIVYYNEAQ